MTIHREGYRLLIVTTVVMVVALVALKVWAPGAIPFFIGLFIPLLAFLLWFFRSPRRPVDSPDDHLVLAPADGRVVVIEEVEEPEFFRDRRLQVSIFMSVFDVHLNRVPVSGRVDYYKYHPGRFLVAWHPKSSLDNERSTVVIGNNAGKVLLRQIAGALARRISTYLVPGTQVRQGSELGFIRFGSRVDILLPLDARVEVRHGQAVRGNRTVIARLNPAPAGVESRSNPAFRLDTL